MNLTPLQSYSALLQSLQQAKTFEEVCDLLHRAIMSDPLETHKDLYAFLGHNPEAIEAIHRFEGHEKFHGALWAIIYGEPSDLSRLTNMSTALKFSSQAVPMDPHTALSCIDITHYPVVIDHTHYPMVVKK